VWQRVLKGRAEGLCEILDEPPQFKKQIACEVLDGVVRPDLRQETRV
jgi:hypothetical protein